MADPKTPSGEHAWVGYYNKDGELMFIITSKNGNREFYFLYEISDGKFKKLGKSKNPLEMCEKYNVIERIRKP